MEELNSIIQRICDIEIEVGIDENASRFIQLIRGIPSDTHTSNDGQTVRRTTQCMSNNLMCFIHWTVQSIIDSNKKIHTSSTCRYYGNSARWIQSPFTNSIGCVRNIKINIIRCCNKDTRWLSWTNKNILIWCIIPLKPDDETSISEIG